MSCAPMNWRTTSGVAAHSSTVIPTGGSDSSIRSVCRTVRRVSNGDYADRPLRHQAIRWLHCCIVNGYETGGVAGLQLKYHGSIPYLTADERQAVIDWLKVQNEWSVDQLAQHIDATFAVVFQSRQSYYQLLEEARISYKKAQSTHPEKDPDRVAAKKKRSRRS